MKGMSEVVSHMTRELVNLAKPEFAPKLLSP